MSPKQFYYSLYATVLSEFSIRQGTSAIYTLKVLLDKLVPKIQIVSSNLIIGGITFSEVQEMSKEDALLTLEVLTEDEKAAALLPVSDNSASIRNLQKRLLAARERGSRELRDLIDEAFLPLFQKFDAMNSFVYI